MTSNGQVISLSFYRFGTTRDRLWAFTQMQWARAPLRAIDQIGFVKQFGTGGRESFHPYPNFGVYAILATWPGLETAREGLGNAPVFQRYCEHSIENWTVYLSGISSRGLWDKVAPFEAIAPERQPSPIAVLTRATIKAKHLWRFWRSAPDISAMTRDEPDLLFKMGMGEIPWIHQVTFSIWRNVRSMTQFAYKSGFHSEAVRRKRAEDWFEEELFARFAVLAAEGSWQGENPLAAMDQPMLMPNVAYETAASA